MPLVDDRDFLIICPNSHYLNSFSNSLPNQANNPIFAETFENAALIQAMDSIQTFISRIILLVGVLLAGSVTVVAQGDPEQSQNVDSQEEGVYDPTNTAFHHISDQNVFSLGFYDVPLPVILYAPGHGVSTFLSSRFGIGENGNGTLAVDRYVLVEGRVRRVADDSFPLGEVSISEDSFDFRTEVKPDGSEGEIVYLHHEGEVYRLDNTSTLDGGLLGGGLTSFYDFSPTKNVIFMIAVMVFLLWVFRKAAKRYEEDALRAPKGVQSLLEVMFIFIRDEIAKPFLGPDYMRFLPYLMTLFFLIFSINLFGQIPFLGSPNVTGNLTFTLMLAVVTMLVVSFNGTKMFWQNTLWMPGLPGFVKPILSVVEILGMIIKPLTLTLRLAANMTAGHIMMVIFVSMLFIFNDAGRNLVGSVPGLLLAGPLSMFMMALELIVISVQAFVFTILSASYIGAAIAKE